MALVFFSKNFAVHLGAGLADLDGADHKIVLVEGYTFDRDDTTYDDISAYELPTYGGYVEGGQLLQNVTWGFDEVSGGAVWDADDPEWVTTDDGIGPTTGAWIYDDTSGDKNLLCYIEFSTVRMVEPPENFIIIFNVGGIFRLGDNL